MAKKTVYDNPKAIFTAVSQCKSDCRITHDSDTTKYCDDCKAAYKARGEIIEGMKSMLFGMAIPISIKYHSDVEDLVHTAISKILKEFHRFKPELGFSPNTYFGLIAHQVMNDYASRDKTIKPPPNYAKTKTTSLQRHQAHTIVSLEGFVTQDADGSMNHIGLDASNNLVDDGAEDPHDILERKETIQIVRMAINALPEKLKQIILQKLEGKDYGQISKKMRIGKSCVRFWEAEARKKIRDFIVEKKWLDK